MTKKKKKQQETSRNKSNTTTITPIAIAQTRIGQTEDRKHFLWKNRREGKIITHECNTTNTWLKRTEILKL